MKRSRAPNLAAALLILGAGAGATVNLDARTVALPMHPTPAAKPASPASRAGLLFVDSLVGRSGKLRAMFVSADKHSFANEVLESLFGDSAVAVPGVYAVSDSLVPEPFCFITLLPFSAKQRGRIGRYRIGYWPRERHPSRFADDLLPDGFIKVTPENEDTYVSEHFRLRDFLTHDQEDVWPKYLVLDRRLVDKLELVIEDLGEHGVPVRHLSIMSGFRTPEYNVQGVGRRGGRARDSRHQYGDAADVFVDNDESGRMDDINHDGRVDVRDAGVIRAAVNRVEAEHPELSGGVGVYRATRAHGPFTHIDARGRRVRWGAH